MKKTSILKKIFSVENKDNHKVTTIFGFKFKVKNKYKKLLDTIVLQEKLIKNQQLVIDKISQNISKISEEQINNKKELSSIKNCITDKPIQSIQKSLFHLAGMETAKYIVEKMPTVPYFKNKYDLLTFALSKTDLEGLYLEFGVFSGHTINHISKIVTTKTVYGFDSFEGLPEDWRSGFDKGCFFKDNLPQVNSNVELIKGWFDNTLPDFSQDHTEQCAFIHVDCDLYSSTKTIFNTLKNQIASGTIIVFDEYFNYPNWQKHEYKAFQEFITESGLNYEYLGYVYTSEQVAVIIL